MGGKSYSFTDDDSGDDKAAERSYTFVEDDAPARTLSPETHARADVTDQRGGNVAPSLEGVAPVEPADSRPQWLLGLLGANDPAKVAAAKQEQLSSANAAARDWTHLADHPADIAGRVAADAFGTLAGGGTAGLSSGLGAGGRVIANALNGGVVGGARGYADDPNHGAVQALKTAGVSAGLSGLLSSAGELFGGGEKVTQDVGDIARQRAYGLGSKELGAFAQRNASEAADAARAAGLTPAEVQAAATEAGTSGAARRALIQQSEQLVKPNIFAPRGPSQIEGQFGTAANKLNGQIESNINTATDRGAQLPPDPRGLVTRNLYGAADDAATGGFTARQAPALSENAQYVQRGPQQFTPQDVRAQKIGWDQQAFKGEPGTPESYQGQANLATANQYRGMLNNYVGQGGEDLSAGFDQANQNYGLAATIRDAAHARGLGPANVNEGSPLSSAGNFAANALTGGGLAADATANAARLAQGTFGAASDFSNIAASASPTAISALANAGRNRPTSSQSDAYSQAQTGQDSRGHQLGANIDTALDSNPQLLGSYADKFAHTDDEERSALAERLARTDPDFKPIYARLTGASR